MWNSQSAPGANLASPGGGAGGDGGGTGLATHQIHDRVDHTQSYLCRHQFRSVIARIKYYRGFLTFTSSVVNIFSS